jgi:Domain of unknown function (DUF4279)
MSNIHPFPAKRKSPYIFGGPVDSAKVSLRIFGDELVPGAISELLAAKPNISCIKGEQRFTSSGIIFEKTGKWILHGNLPENAPLEDQINALLNAVTNDLSIWADLAGQDFRLEIFCGVFLEAFNRGFVLSKDLLSELSDRNLQLNMDLYSHYE